MAAVESTQTMHEPLYMWAESFIMQPSHGRKRAVSTELSLLETVTTVAEYWDRLQLHTARTASLASLHIFKAGVTPQYDDPRNSNGGHFKMKPHGSEEATAALDRFSHALIGGGFPFNSAINGITIARKAKSSLLKLWICDSLDAEVVATLTAWMDVNVAEFCGRRLFSPHKYILNTFSQQQQARQLTPVPRLPPAPLPYVSGGPWELSVQPPGLPPPFPLGAAPFDLPPMPFFPPPLPCTGVWVGSLGRGVSDPPSRPDSDSDCLTPRSRSSVSPDSSEYVRSLGSLMDFSRHDPAWGAATAAAVAFRLEATVRRLRFGRSPHHQLPPAPFSSASSSSDYGADTMG